MQHDPYQTTFADMLGRGAELRVTETHEQVAAAEPAPSRISRRLTRTQVIDRIVAINTSATTAFLERFETPACTVIWNIWMWPAAREVGFPHGSDRVIPRRS